MKVTPHIHRKLWLNTILKTLALLSLLIIAAWLSTRYHTQTDLTANQNNTLSPVSIKVLQKLSAPIQIHVLISDPSLRQQIADLLAQYQRVKSSITIDYSDPKAHPELSKKYHLSSVGAVVVEYRGKHEKITYLDENSLTNTLLQLANSQDIWLSFLTGHGERSLEGQANFDLGLFGAELQKRGIHPQSLNLAKTGAIPDNSSLLVLTEPGVSLLPAEMQRITNYLKHGGNLLLLTDPERNALHPLLHHLGLKKLSGQLLSAQSSLYGVDNPGFILISQYPSHPVTTAFKDMTIFPGVAVLQNTENSEFNLHTLLQSDTQAWLESDPATADSQFDADSQEQMGQLDFAYSLTRTLKTGRQQRIIIIGDADFLSNAYLNNVGNLELGLRMIQWLTHNDQFIDIPARDSVGKSLHFNDLTLGLLSTFFLILLPLIFVLSGFYIWRKRKQN